MIKLFKITKTAWIAFFVALAAAFIMGSVSHAQTDDPNGIAKQHGVTFPIAELGGCKNYSECRSFCEDPVNSTACINFAKAKGFYKEDQIQSKKETILAAAKSQLGCDSEDSCKTVCEIASNRDKCSSFARSQGLTGGYVEDTKKEEIVQKAKAVLGCDSEDSCKETCQKEENRQKCSEFAKEAGLRGGEQRVGPGGCNSEETCKAFCSSPQNFQVCSGFTQVAGGNFSGPGGCNSEESCKSYCESHQDECQAFGSGPNNSFNAQEACNRTPNCAWNQNTCQCGFYGQTEETRKAAEQYSQFCRNNPDKCQGAAQNREQIQQAENYCRQNPDKCKSDGGANMGRPDPAAECVRFGCKWNINSCQCGSNTNTTTTPPVPSSRDQQEAQCRSGGGSCDWGSGYCNCQGYKAPAGGTSTNSGGYSGGRYEDPATACARGGGCVWTNNSCQCPNSPTYSGTTDPATGCRNAGGNWTGSYCQMPNTTTSPSNTTTNTAPSGMSRDQQEAGCRSCGGSCSWNGDMCNCQCANSGSSGGSTTTASSPAPQPSTVPAPQTTSEPAPAPTTTTTQQSTPAPSPTVQGVSAFRSLIERLLDFLR